MNEPIKQQAGISLFEILITLLVLACGLLVLSGGLANVVTGQTLEKQRTEALAQAAKKMDELRAYSTLTTTSGTLAYADISTSSDTISGVSANYTRNWTVTSNSTPGFLNVSMTVSWTDNQNNPQSVTVNSLIGQLNPASEAAQVISPI